MLWKLPMGSFINKIKKLNGFLPFLGLIFVIVAHHFTDIIYFKFYPPIMNFCIFSIFFFSLFQKYTVIQKLALKMEPDITDVTLKYTRNLTYIWAIFTFLNFLVSIYTIFLPKEIWALYNGFISYFLVGFIFIIEYIVRINFKRKYGK